MKCDSSRKRSESIPDAVYIAPGAETCVSDLIRRRAYELFEERGRQPGHDVEDWLQAEREIKSNWGGHDG
jgi:hypothetical protein